MQSLRNAGSCEAPKCLDVKTSTLAEHSDRSVSGEGRLVQAGGGDPTCRPIRHPTVVRHPDAIAPEPFLVGAPLVLPD